MVSILLNNSEWLWSYNTLKIKGPVFLVDNERLEPVFSKITLKSEERLVNGQTERRYLAIYEAFPDISLEICFREAEDNAIIKFFYKLKSESKRYLTKPNGIDELTYFSFFCEPDSSFKEVQFSAFNELVHSFCLAEEPVSVKQFENNAKIMGPMLIYQNKQQSYLAAYEHGSELQDAFLNFCLNEKYEISVCAEKGNYYSGYDISAGYETIWFQIGGVSGGEAALSEEYRSFQLLYSSEYTESRKPYIYYNTWGLQERKKEWEKGTYKESVNLDRMLKEIDIAHEIGVDVFVIDACWYDKTGEWTIDEQSFPDKMAEIKGRLDSYNMKLGLWFAPMAAYYEGDIYLKNRDLAMSKEGEYPKKEQAVTTDAWGAPPSFCMCITSEYWKLFADRLISLYKSLGVTYFKWDALGQYGCCSPLHNHGTSENLLSERRDCCAFGQVIHMGKIVDRLHRECPEAIVDFDITERGRVMGLSFLSHGKYYLVNNGPYYDSYNISYNSENTWNNVFVNPGSARGWICRTPLTYDKWIPSTLFLTHYLADGERSSQIQNLASLILGQNGVWGDLTKVSRDGVSLFSEILTKYKEVRDDITKSNMIRTGFPGSSPEIYEKINKKNKKGVVVIFANSNQTVSYITTNIADTSFWSDNNMTVSYDSRSRAIIDCNFDKAGAIIIFFGCK